MGTGQERARLGVSRCIVEYRPAAKKSLAKIARQDQLRIYAAIELLQENPRPPASIKIQGSEFFRVRVGDYRILYSVENQRLLVLIIEIGHRREVYRSVND